MARLDVYRVQGAYLLDCQSDYLGGLDTRFVVPLVPIAGAPRVKRLNPVFRVDGEELVMATQLGASVPTVQLRERVMSLVHEHASVIDAFDALLTEY